MMSKQTTSMHYSGESRSSTEEKRFDKEDNVIDMIKPRVKEETHVKYHSVQQL